MYRGIGIVMVLAAVVSTAPASAGEPGGWRTSASTGEPFEEAFDGPLEPGESAFWNGPFVASSGALGLSLVGPEACAIPSVKCFDYAFDVAAGGGSLRVAVDHPALDDHIGVALRDPAGRVVASGTGSYGVAVASVEVRAPAPVAGRWTATVIGHEITNSGFRVRARLDRFQPPTSGERHVLEPNIRSIAPFEIAFGPCYRSEVRQYAAVRCLRFSQGPENVGRGPLELTARGVGAPGSDANGQTTLVGPQYQRLHFSDGTTSEVPAGTFEFHAQHRHYHHSATGGYRLFEVVDPVDGGLREAGKGPKQGYCMADSLIADWRSFAQDPARLEHEYLEPHNCSAAVPGGVEMRLTRGWGDVYLHSMEGQYVDFGTNPDGLYLIRATSLEDGSVTESRTDDNVSYAYIRVTGGSVEVLERGRGASPWDPERVIVDDGRRAGLNDPKCVPGGDCSPGG